MNILPTIWMLGLSFYDYTLTSAKGATFAGFSNYLDFVRNEQLSSSISRTFVFLLIAIICQTLLGILIGVLFWKNDKMPGRRLALTLFLPYGSNADGDRTILETYFRPDIWGN